MAKKKRHPLIPLKDQQQELFDAEYKAFCRTIQLLGYQKIGPDAALIDITQKRLENPKRVSLKKVLAQDRYDYFSRTGYSVVIQPGVINNTFVKRLSVYIMIRDEKQDRVFSRQFHRLTVESFFTVFTAYAQAAKNVVDARPTHGRQMNYMNLIEKNITSYVWELGNEECTFDISLHTVDSMGSEQINSIFEKENNLKKYFDKYRTAKEYMRNIRKKWTKEYMRNFRKKGN